MYFTVQRCNNGQLTLITPSESTPKKDCCSNSDSRYDPPHNSCRYYSFIWSTWSNTGYWKWKSILTGTVKYMFQIYMSLASIILGIDTIKNHTWPRISHGKMTKIQLNITKESLEVSPFPAGDHKAAMNRRESMTNTRHKSHKWSTKEVPPLNGQSNILLERLNQFHSTNLTLSSDVDKNTRLVCMKDP